MKYVALLRGINVGGNSLIKMALLKSAVESAGFKNVSTYINSGNVLFSSDETDKITLAKTITNIIDKTFDLDIKTVVFSKSDMEKIIKDMPKDWGSDLLWRYNTLFLIPPYDINKMYEAFGELKPDIEILEKGAGVLYQAVEFKSFGRSRTGKLAGLPIYKQMTIRNYNTTVKISTLLKAM